MKIDELREKPHWSYTALNTYLNVCPLQYFFRYIEQAEVEQTSACLLFGQAFHAALSQQADVANNGSNLSIENLGDMFDEYFNASVKATDNVKFKVGEDTDTMSDLARRMFKPVLDNWNDFYNIRSIAEGFRITVPGLEKPLVGEFDLVVNDGREPCIVDWKTSSSRWPSGKADRDLQATVFSYAYNKMHDEIPLFRFDVVTKAKMPTCETYYTMRSQTDFDRFEMLANKVQDAVDKGVFLPNETSFACSECPYKNRCKNWKG